MREKSLVDNGDGSDDDDEEEEDDKGDEDVEVKSLKMLATILAPIANLNALLLSTPVHAGLFPYALLPTLHAARISLLHRALSEKAWEATSEDVRRTRGKPTWAYNIVGFLVMVS